MPPPIQPVTAEIVTEAAEIDQTNLRANLKEVIIAASERPELTKPWIVSGPVLKVLKLPILEAHADCSAEP